MLEHAKNPQFVGFDDCVYVDIAPSATIPTIQTMVQEAQKVQNGAEMQQQTQQLKKEVQQLKINYKDFTISEELIIRAFKMQGCKIEKSKGGILIKKETQTVNKLNEEQSLQQLAGTQNNWHIQFLGKAVSSNPYEPHQKTTFVAVRRENKINLDEKDGYVQRLEEQQKVQNSICSSTTDPNENIYALL